MILALDTCLVPVLEDIQHNIIESGLQPEPTTSCQDDFVLQPEEDNVPTRNSVTLAVLVCWAFYELSYNDENHMENHLNVSRCFRWVFGFF